MKSIVISTAIALLAATAQSAPALAHALAPRQFEASITFIGVDSSDFYFLQFPTNGEPVTIGTHRE